MILAPKSGDWKVIERLPKDPDAIDIGALKRARDLETFHKARARDGERHD